MATSVGNTIIDASQDATLSPTYNSDLVQVEANGNIYLFQTNSNVYVTTVEQQAVQQFITNDVNTPGGGNLQIQYNNSGNLSGDPSLTFDPVSKILNVAGASFGAPSSIRIPGGSNAWVLSTDGNGNLSWRQPLSGNGTVGGNVGTVQFNDGGNFNGSNAFTFDTVTESVFANTLSVTQLTGNTFVCDTLVLGEAAGGNIVPASSTTWDDSTTTGTSPDQVLWTYSTATCSSIDIHITATTDDNSARQVNKILLVALGSNIDYTEYGKINIGPSIGDYQISGSGVVTLSVTPTYSGTVIYRIIATVYN